MTCTADRCNRPTFRRALCRHHYEAQRRAQLPVYEAARTVVDYRLRLEMAHARVTQAVLALEHPYVGFGRTPADLLHEALDCLEGA